MWGYFTSIRTVTIEAESTMYVYTPDKVSYMIYTDMAYSDSDKNEPLGITYFRHTT